ncbi:MAG: DUF2577 domain-containing protein [Lachnospiraceae bacterium]|nr:DUF2577 domain-containing protein [Lachnospiraceae bacterium]
MSDATELIQTIKSAAVDAVNASKPTTVCYGTVISASPLQIRIDQKTTLGTNQLVLSRNVSDYETTVTVEWETEETGGGSDEAAFDSHAHSISGEKTITIHNGLAAGDAVILLRQQGGQKYFVVDKIG